MSRNLNCRMKLQQFHDLILIKSDDVICPEFKSKGGFPIRVKTQIRYLIYCFYHNLSYKKDKNKITTYHKISYLNFNFDRKFTY